MAEERQTTEGNFDLPHSARVNRYFATIHLLDEAKLNFVNFNVRGSIAGCILLGFNQMTLGVAVELDIVAFL